jgi:hypothetical protein
MIERDHPEGHEEHGRINATTEVAAEQIIAELQHPREGAIAECTDHRWKAIAIGKEECSAVVWSSSGVTSLSRMTGQAPTLS